MGDLYRLPTAENRDVVALEPDELVLELDVATPDSSVYLKAMERRTWSFPLVGVAAARFGERASYGLAGVAPIPGGRSGSARNESLRGKHPAALARLVGHATQSGTCRASLWRTT